jgi:hypothetical protein
MKQTGFPIFIGLILCAGNLLNAQSVPCLSCNTVITAIDSASYTLNAGDTICIHSEGILRGGIVLNGGVICNSGNLNPVSFIVQSGTIINNGIFTIPADLQLNAGSHLINHAEGIVNVTGYFSVHHASASATNEGSINIQGNLLAASGSITNNGVINCNHNSAAPHLSGNGTVNESSPN